VTRLSDTIQLIGQVTTADASGQSSGVVTADVSINEIMSASFKDAPKYDLVSDAELDVSLASLGLASISLLVVKPTGGYVVLGLTGPDGANQKVTVTDLAVLMSKTRPFTAFSLTRPPGVPVTVQTFVAQQA